MLISHFYHGITVTGDISFQLFASNRPFFSYLFIEFDKFWLECQPKDIMEFNRIRDLFENIVRTKLEDKTTCFRVNIEVDTVWYCALVVQYKDIHVWRPTLRNAWVRFSDSKNHTLIKLPRRWRKELAKGQNCDLDISSLVGEQNSS